MNVEKLTAAHVYGLRVQAAQLQDVVGFLNDTNVGAIVNSEHAWALLDDGVVLACGGYTLLWAGRYQIWALLSEDIGPAGLLALTRVTMRSFQILGRCRIETVVRTGFDAGHRWVRLLGFTCETPDPMLRYMPDGGSAFLYSKVI